MKTAHVFSYSQIVKTVPKNAINNFVIRTKLSFENVLKISQNADTPGEAIYEYKIGNLSSAEFREKMNQVFASKGGLTLANDVFDSCWNSMCIVESDTTKKLYDLQEKNNFHIHVIGRSNELQHNYIQNEMHKQTVVPVITYSCSFEEKTLDINELQKLAADNLLSQNFQPEWHYSSAESAVNILAEIYNVDPVL